MTFALAEGRARIERMPGEQEKPPQRDNVVKEGHVYDKNGPGASDARFFRRAARAEDTRRDQQVAVARVDEPVDILS